jgi:cell wall-associated NlpC family hydrolase
MTDTPPAATTVAIALIVSAIGLLLAPVLLIAAAAGTPTTAAASMCAGGAAQTVAGTALSTEQLTNADTIVAAVAAMGEPAYAATIAIATAYQESRLLNSDPKGGAIGAGHDTQGLFQQRASTYTAAVATNPALATRVFITALVAVPNWATIPLTEAAQAVQRSAFPDAYATWQPLAEQLTGQLWPIALQVADAAQVAATSSPASMPPATQSPKACADTGAAGGSNVAGTATVPAGLVIDGSPAAQIAVAFAVAQLGKPYVYGAVGPNSYDCSGLVMAAWAHASVAIPHYSVTQLNSGTPEPTDLSQAVAGDLVFIPGSDGTPAAPGHVGMVIGHLGTQVYLIQAPMTGLRVEITDAAAWAGQVVDVRHLG